MWRIGPPQIRPPQAGPPEVGPLEVVAPESGTTEVGTPQVRPGEIRPEIMVRIDVVLEAVRLRDPGGDDTPQVGLPEVRPAEDRPVEPACPEIDPAEHGPMEVDQAKVQIPQMGGTEVGEAKVGEMQRRDGFAIASPPVPFGDPLPAASEEFDGFPGIHDEILKNPIPAGSSHLRSSEPDLHPSLCGEAWCSR